MHPVRIATDTCAVCGRPRCSADSASWAASGCPVCQRAPAPAPTPPSDLERVVRGALAALTLGLLGGVIGSEYVGATDFGLFVAVPAVAGVAVGEGALLAAGSDGRGRAGGAVRLLSLLAAVGGSMFAFLLVVGGSSPFTPLTDTLPPHLATAAALLLWTQPRRPKKVPPDRDLSAARTDTA